MREGRRGSGERAESGGGASKKRGVLWLLPSILSISPATAARQHAPRRGRLQRGAHFESWESGGSRAVWRLDSGGRRSGVKREIVTSCFFFLKRGEELKEEFEEEKTLSSLSFILFLRRASLSSASSFFFGLASRPSLASHGNASFSPRPLQRAFVRGGPALRQNAFEHQPSPVAHADIL